MKLRWLCVLVYLAALMAAGCAQQPRTSTGEIADVEEYIREFEPDQGDQEISERILQNGCVQDRETAIAIASAVLRSIYGDGFDNGLPLLVHYDGERQAWLLKSQLPQAEEGSYIAGGCKHIVIRRSDARVVAVWGEL